MKSLTLLIKPASSLCGLRCRYCFYDDVSERRQAKSLGMMTQKTARRLLEAAFEALEPGGAVQFLFQGGEPTLAGLDFFRGFVRMERELRPASAVAGYAIQTNGMALDGEWVAFFREHGFLVGLSMDGSRELHDQFRVDAGGRGSWDRAAHALALLDNAGVETNLLCVVTGPLARYPRRVYRSLQGLGEHALQFLPCLEPLGAEPGGERHSLSPRAYGRFLCELFDCWYGDWAAGRYVSVRMFDDCLRLLLNMAPGSCAAAGACGSYLVVEGDGSLYPCDFYVLDEWRLGSIHELSVGEALASPLERAFLEEGSRRPAACAGCRHLALCRGGCKRDWVSPEAGHYYCPALLAFFDYAGPRLAEVARHVGQL